MRFVPPAAPLPLRNFRALVVDDVPEMRASLRRQLGMLDVTDVDTVGDADSAIRALSTGHYDLVLCDYHLGGGTNGQQLLEHLRENDRLPPGTIFFMCTGENGYVQVVAAAEVHPDDYLLKPFTPAAIESRIRRHFARLEALRAAHRALATGDAEAVAAACDAVVAGGGRFEVDALRLKAKALIEAGEPARARAAYEAVLARHDGLAWAKLGRARCLHAEGEIEAAASTAQALAARCPHMPEPWELLAKVHAARGEAADAVALLRRAADALPSARRHRLVAEAAWRAGDSTTAAEAWGKLVRLTRGSMVDRPMDTLRLAQAQVDTGEAKAALATLAQVPRRVASEDRFSGAAQAVAAQAHARLDDPAAAGRCLEAAIARLGERPGAEATILLGRAAFACGRVQDGLRLIGEAIRADHAAPDVERLARHALARAGRLEEADALFETARREVMDLLAEARRLMRQMKADESLALLDRALERMPENGAVRMAAAQLTLLWISQRGADPARVAAARAHLARLAASQPDDPGVLRMRRFLHELAARPREAGGPGEADPADPASTGAGDGLPAGNPA